MCLWRLHNSTPVSGLIEDTNNFFFHLNLSTLSQKWLVMNNKYDNTFIELLNIWVIYLHTYDMFKVGHKMKTSLHAQYVNKFWLSQCLSVIVENGINISHDMWFYSVLCYVNNQWSFLDIS